MRYIGVCLLLAETLLSAQTRSPVQAALADGGRITLLQSFGRARYTKCALTVFYNQPPLPGTDRIELSCTPLPYPRVDDVTAYRHLSAAEVALIAGLANASDLYSGGHVGNGAGIGPEGPWERLEVGRCCGRNDAVVLITDGNATFATGSRRDLLKLLSQWRAELMPKLPKPQR